MSTILDEPDYYSLVYYFASPPVRIASIVTACCKLSREFLGPVRPYLRWGLGRFQQQRRVIRFGLESTELQSGFAEKPLEGLSLFLPNRESKKVSPNDFVWLLDYQPDPVESVHFEPILGVHFGIPFLTDLQTGRLRAFTEALSQSVIDNAEPCHALADLGKMSLTGRGGLYHSQVPLCVPFDRLIRRRVWLRLGEQRKRKLRGVFWGQLLSPWMANQLGGPEAFTTEYRKLEDPVHKDLVRVFPDGSMLVRLSNSPLDIRPSRPCATPPVIGPLPWMIDRAAWLHERFDRAGLL